MHSVQNTSFHFQHWNWQGIWHVPDAEVQKVVVAFHGFGRPMEEMGNYLPLYTLDTAMLSVGIAHQNGSTVPPTPSGAPVLEPITMEQALTSWLRELEVGHCEVHLLGYSLGGRLALEPFLFRLPLRVTLVPQEVPPVAPCQVEESFDNPQYGKSQPSKNTKLEPDSMAAWLTSSCRKNSRASGFVKFQKGLPFLRPRQTSPLSLRRNSSGRL